MTACLELSPAQATAFRLQRQHLLGPAESGVAAAGRLLGAQAQVQSAAILQLRARTSDVTQGSVRRLLEQDRRLVKLWAQRATLHLVPIDDVPLALTLRRRFTDRYHRWLASEGLSADQIHRLAAAIGEALDGQTLSRGELSARLTPVLGDWARPWLENSWGGAIKLAASMGMICHGPDRGGETTFVRLDGWAELPAIDLDEALATLAQRYLAAFGPAAPRDFAKFTGARGFRRPGPADPARTDRWPDGAGPRRGRGRSPPCGAAAGNDHGVAAFRSVLAGACRHDGDRRAQAAVANLPYGRLDRADDSAQRPSRGDLAVSPAGCAMAGADHAVHPHGQTTASSSRAAPVAPGRGVRGF